MSLYEKVVLLRIQELLSESEETHERRKNRIQELVVSKDDDDLFLGFLAMYGLMQYEKQET